jgi:hypothetical protein
MALDLQPSLEQPLSETLRQVADPDPAPELPKVSKERMCGAVTTAAAMNDLPAVFLLRLIWHESRLDPMAISPAGALGVAQFMPRVASSIGLTDPFDPLEALPAAGRFLRSLHAKFGNLGLTAAAYNAGAQRIKDWLERRGKLPQETRDYVVRITGVSPEFWAKPAPSQVTIKMPPVPCPAMETVVVNAGSVPFPVRRPGGTLRNGETAVAAASKPHGRAMLTRKKRLAAPAAAPPRRHNHYASSR